MLASALAAVPAMAQPAYQPSRAGAASTRESPADVLARNVRALATSPRDLGSLIGAGQAAVETGDTQAALAFFARAEEVAPNNGQVKAGMGSAFVQAVQPQAALKFFADAASLGVPVQSFAKDRGLAYDMVGDQVRAQADYALAMARGPDAETERRLALSKAIGGDQAGALAVLDGQVKRHDPAGWRARAFVLALTGDSAAAELAVQAAMPGQARAMLPFLTRLPQLSAADKAMAVHFGRFPSAGASSATRYASAAPVTAGRPDARQPALGAPQAKAAPVQTRPAATVPVSANPRPAAIVPVDLTPSQVSTGPATSPAEDRIDFADVAAEIAALEPEAAPQETPPAQVAEAKPAPKPKPAAVKPAPQKKAEPAKPREPSRIWVQLAVAQDKKAFPGEYRRIKAKAPKLLTSTTAWTTPLRSTNRLLVGPFKTEKEARDLVNELSKLKISSFAWTSEAGQAIEKLPAK